MAEQAVGSVASAVVGQITDRTLSTVLRKLRTPATTHEKLQRLEMLLLRIRSAIEVSEKHAIESSSLIQWRQKLREAAEEGGQVLRGFQQRARDDEAARNAAAAAATAAEEQQGCGNSSSSAGGSVATGASVAVSFTWSALSGMARRMHGATRALFYSDEDMEKLNSSLERLEKLSPDIQEFVILLHLEVSPKLEQRPECYGKCWLVWAELRRWSMKETWKISYGWHGGRPSCGRPSGGATSSLATSSPAATSTEELAV